MCRMDATLKELTGLVKEVRPDARRKGTVFKFATVFMDRSGRYRYGWLAAGTSSAALLSGLRRRYHGDHDPKVLVA